MLGTTPALFRHLRHGDRQPLRFTNGQPFAGPFEAVLGAEVARRLAYALGDTITLHHGSGHLDDHDDHGPTGNTHADKPFRIVGILAPTGTPTDRTVHVSLESLEALHLDWQGGAPVPGLHIPPEMAIKFDLTPKTLDAALIGLHQRTDIFRFQRQVADFHDEALMAILPGLAMDELWQLIGGAERLLRGIGWLVVGVGLTVAGLLLGLALVEGASRLLAPWLTAHLGVDLTHNAFSADELQLIATVLVTGFLASLLPGWRASRMSLADGLIPRL